jgi:hypothetical protein
MIDRSRRERIDRFVDAAGAVFAGLVIAAAVIVIIW